MSRKAVIMDKTYALVCEVEYKLGKESSQWETVETSKSGSRRSEQEEGGVRKVRGRIKRK